MARASIKALRSDIELQSVLRYRSANSRCANGEVHIDGLGDALLHNHNWHLNVVALYAGALHFDDPVMLVKRTRHCDAAREPRLRCARHLRE